MKKLLLLILSTLLLTASCSKTPEADTGNTTANGQSQEGSQVETTTADLLAKYDFKGQEIRILTSINVSDGVISNSNYMIQGEEEITGEAVNDSVFKRNADVEELLNVKFKYTPMNEDYGSVEKAISKIIASGSDEYDLVINDLRSVANLSIQGMFLNIKKNSVFDLSQNYWYDDFMDEVSIGKDKSYILAGDYFIDILRNCHSLFMNKTMLDERTPGKSEEVYKTVLDGNWTLDEFTSLTKEFLVDLDGNGKYEKTDQYGFICVGTWGSAMPFMISADTDVITKDAEGIPSITIQNEKSIQLFDKLTQMFLTTGSGSNSGFSGTELISQFQNRRSLIVGFQRLSTLESLRDMQDEIAVLPYPKLNPDQKEYVTSAHDTTEVGAIPITTPHFDTVCIVLEALNRETERTIIPVYYEQALKIKYTRDETSAKIIDIIHDNMRNVFPLAYSEKVSGLLTLYDVGVTKNFASASEKLVPKAETQLKKAVEAILSIED